MADAAGGIGKPFRGGPGRELYSLACLAHAVEAHAATLANKAAARIAAGMPGNADELAALAAPLPVLPDAATEARELVATVANATCEEDVWAASYGIVDALGLEAAIELTAALAGEGDDAFVEAVARDGDRVAAVLAARAWTLPADWRQTGNAAG